MPALTFVNFSAPAQSATVDGVVVVKGFASVSQIDREREIVPDPREFDVASFMATPTLLMDHKFVLDEFGNQSAAGVVRKAVPAVVKSISDDLVEVYSLDGDTLVDTLDLRISPTLKVGDRGLFVEAEVRHPVTIQKVLSGEMGGFSWRGYTRMKSKTVCSDGGPCTTLRDIDLVEISVVHHPCQRQSTLMIAKTVDGEVQLSQEDINKVRFYGVRFPKIHYPSSRTVEAYLSAKNLEYASIEEDDTFYLAVTAPKCGFDCSKSIAISMGGVEFISAPEKDKEDDILVATHVGCQCMTPVSVLEKKPMADSQKKLRLYLLNEQGFLTRFPTLKSQVMKSTATLDGEDVEVYTLELPEDVTTETVAEEVPSEAPVQGSEVVADSSELLQKIAELQAMLDAKQPVVEAPAETAPVPVDQQIVTQLEAVQKQLDEATRKFDGVKDENDKLKSVLSTLVDKYNQLTPAHGAREEKVQTVKSVSQPTDNQTIVGQFILGAFPRR